jgi:NTE family protein
MGLKLNLALQGGGAHGAYSWGVLDRLLEEEDIDLEGVSGTSAGAINAVVLADGLMKGGRAGAKENLASFWKKIADAGSVTPFGAFSHVPISQEWMTNLWVYPWLRTLTTFFSPYQMNPAGYHPMRSLLEESIDFKRVRKCDKISLYITATQVNNGQPAVFDSSQLTTEHVLASTALPWLFQAVEIKGKHYWDGGYIGNPALWPLIYECNSRDILLVKINPLEIKDSPPREGIDILNRISDISFNSSLIAEMRAIHFVQKLVRDGQLKDSRYKDMNIHMVERPDEMDEYEVATKFTVDMGFFEELRALGYKACDKWLKKHKACINKCSSLDIEKHFLQSSQPI